MLNFTGSEPKSIPVGSPQTQLGELIALPILRG